MGVIKKDKVKIAGTHAIAPAVIAETASAGPIGRIVRQDDAGAVIEVTCNCGERIELHCTYGGSAG